MSVLKLVAAPHEILSTRAREVEEAEFGDELVEFTSNMAESMYARRGIGLAAPQVNDGRRIIVVDPFGEGKEIYRMVNPVILERSEETVVAEEQCLSVPFGKVKVDRARYIHLQWFSPDGSGPHTEEFVDWPATVFQHEIDHLDGVTLYDRMSHFKKKRYLKSRKKKIGF